MPNKWNTIWHATNCLVSKTMDYINFQGESEHVSYFFSLSSLLNHPKWDSGGKLQAQKSEGLGTAKSIIIQSLQHCTHCDTSPGLFMQLSCDLQS